MKRPDDRAQPAKKARPPEIPALEWVISGIGLVIVAAAIGVLLYEAIAGDKSPPDVKLNVQSIAQRESGFLVKVRAENIGGEPAAQVDVSAELVEQGKVVETNGTQFDHLPPRSEKEAGVFFKRDPRQGEIRLRAHGYQEP